MDDGGKDAAHCQRCPQKCSWRDHDLASYHYKYYIEQETTASQELSKFKDFPWVFKQVNNPPNVLSTNCSICKYTCHAECHADKFYDCSAMDDGGKDAAHCQHCPQKCSWRDHNWAPYHHKYYIEQETTASQELSKFKDFPWQFFFRKVDNPPNVYSQELQRNKGSGSYQIS